MYYIAHLIIEAGLAVLMLCTVFVIIIAIKRAVLRQPRDTADIRVMTVIAASGRAEELEQTVRSMPRAAGTVIIADCGLTPDARRMAEIFANTGNNIEICAPGDIPAILEDGGWTEENTFA